MKKGTKPETGTHRQVAEELMKRGSKGKSSLPGKQEPHNLIHELQVKQIELELQNEELKMAKAAEHDSTLRYTELYDSAPSGYITITGEGIITDLNLTGARMLGHDRDSLRNTKLDLYVSEGSNSILNEFIQKAFRTHNQESCEVSLSRSDKTVFAFLTGFVRKNGKQCLVTMLDVTESKRAREEKEELMSQIRELIETNKELSRTEKELKENELRLTQMNIDKDRFISILGHDLRSPFSGLLGLSELLRGNVRKFDIDEIEVFANYINSSAQLTYNLLENLLIWGKSQSGRVPFNPQRVNVRDVVKNVLQLLESAAAGKKINVNVSVPSDLYVVSDLEMFKTIVRNLASNAVKFTNRGGRIAINAEKSGTIVTISVSDNGVGIKPENLGRLFDISQVYTTTGTAEEEGSGLGLLICKEFVEKNGGKIGVESIVGEGSRFFFTIPGEEALKSREESADKEIEKLKILIVDDDKASRMILSLIVKSIGKEVLFAHDGQEAITACQRNPDLDLILMDIKMPEVDGLEATRKIRLFNRNVIIIVQTAFSLSYEKENALEAGCNDFISKPIDKNKLYDLIRKYFRKK